MSIYREKNGSVTAPQSETMYLRERREREREREREISVTMYAFT